MGEENLNEKKSLKQKKQRVILRELLEMFLYILVVAILAILVVKFVGQRTKVVGSSMEYTLINNDQLIVDKITYRFSAPKRFDIIVFPHDKKKGIYYIKRIIGLPGESVQIIDGNIYINNKVLKESYGKEKIHDGGLANQLIQLGDDEYFVMGDNRNGSCDSRDPSVGNIKRQDLTGRAWLRIWPFDHFGFVVHQKRES